MTRLIALAFLLALAGCATPEEPSDQPTGGSIQDLLARSHTEKRDRGPQPDRSSGGQDLPPGWRDHMDAWWELWQRDDPRWPEARDQWVALGDEPEQILVENLLRWFILGFEKNRRYEVNRAQRELLLFQDRTVDSLVAGLADAMGDNVIRARCEDLVAVIGDPATPKIQAAFDDASEEGRFSLTRTLRKIGDRRSIPFLIEVADGRDDFKVRIEAIKALGEMGAYEAGPVIRDGLSDRDPSVRKFSAHYIAAVTPEPTRDVLAALIDCMASGEEEGNVELVATCHRSLVRLYGRDMGRRAADWQHVVGRG